MMMLADAQRRMNTLLSTQKGRDFFINAAYGVVFKIHSNMLIGQSKPLEQVAYPVGLCWNHLMHTR
jgi:hypothetical protein